MSFEAFNNDDVQKILDHTLACMSKKALEEQIEKYGSKEKYREYILSTPFTPFAKSLFTTQRYRSKGKGQETQKRNIP